MNRVAAALTALAALACGDSTGPTDIPFGITTFAVLVNPVVNTANQTTVPAPGSTQAAVTVSVASGPSGSTSASGVVVLSPVTAGARTITLTSAGANGQINASIASRELRELAVALSGTTAQIMANVQYAFGGTVVEIRPSMPLSQVNAALAQSNVIVFLRSGTYTGNLQFSGSDVTLFGEGGQGGAVTISGNVDVSGSRNRIRGARITGTLTVPGSDFGMSFSSVANAFNLAGSNGSLLNNAFCGTVNISGSGTRLLGNAGLAPIAARAC